MQDLVIPGWALFLILGEMGWLIWITQQTHQNNKDIAINTNNFKVVSEELNKVGKSIEDLRKDMNSKIDQFFATEISVLKELIKSKS